MSLLRTFLPAVRQQSLPWTAARCLVQQQSQQSTSFSTTAHLEARKKGAPRKDPRITAIRYHLQHGLTPRPLRFSRNRSLRHWTIHRAWHRYLDVQRQTKELELERQYNAMAAACETLRLIDDTGMTREEAARIGAVRKEGVMGRRGMEEGRLFRTAMMKDDIWDGVPIEYARLQTETPGRDGWNHGWTR